MRVQLKSVSDIAFIKYIIVDEVTGKPVIADEYLRPQKYAQRVADMINERLADAEKPSRPVELILKDAKFWIEEANKPRPANTSAMQPTDDSQANGDDSGGCGRLDGRGGVSGGDVSATGQEQKV